MADTIKQSILMHNEEQNNLNSFKANLRRDYNFEEFGSEINLIKKLQEESPSLVILSNSSKNLEDILKLSKDKNIPVIITNASRNDIKDKFPDQTIFDIPGDTSNIADIVKNAIDNHNAKNQPTNTLEHIRASEDKTLKNGR
jgi:serine kinase of HPr protein (carbohydrate metabolism regulator)